MYAGRIRGIVQKLERARATPGLAGRFGAEKHQYRLRPPLAESDLLAYEQRHGIVLPEGYREFLLLAGEGGAGPYYGIEPLAKWDEWFEEDAESPGFLASPCPLADGAPVREAWRAAQERDARRARGIVQPGALPSSAWQEHLPNEWPLWGRGTMHICDQGCTYSARLIVSGDARGRVVYFDAQLWYPPYFVGDDDFLAWYERWLDAALAGGPDFWFGFDNPDYEPRARG